MKIKILIVDDSRIFRSAVAEGLAGADDIEVIGSVWNGIKALEFIRATPPDLVTLDIEMPVMDGLETLQAIQKINAARGANQQIGVIMLSSHTVEGADITVKALEAGAFDFIPKPEGTDLMENIRVLGRQLVTKIRHFRATYSPSALPRPRISRTPDLKKPSADIYPVSRIRAILIGVSTGGPKALAEILPPLCAKVDVPILIVQHMPPTFTQSLARSLNAKCRYEVTEAQHNDIVREHHVYIAPGGRHMKLLKKQQTVKIIVNDHPPEKGCRPSVNCLFRSAATVYGPHAIGIILTGMGMDGTEGAGMLKRDGAIIIGQDEETSVVWGMPGSAQAAGYVDKMLPLWQIPDAVIAMIQRKMQHHR